MGLPDRSLSQPAGHDRLWATERPMSDAISASKKCPDCGESLKADASFCRHCGYVFPVRNSLVAPLEQPALKPADGPTISPPKGFPSWILIVLILVILVVLYYGWLIFRNPSHTGPSDWEVALNQTSANVPEDTEFERFYEKPAAAKQMQMEIRAFDGECLVSFITDEHLSGWKARSVGSLWAKSMAMTYSMFRTLHKSDRDVTVQVFINGQRFGNARMVNGKLR